MISEERKAQLINKIEEAKKNLKYWEDLFYDEVLKR